MRILMSGLGALVLKRHLDLALAQGHRETLGNLFVCFSDQEIIKITEKLC